MIFIIAAYSPKGGELSNLGASRKIEIVVKALSTIDSGLVLINTAHNNSKISKTTISSIDINGVSVCELVPATLPQRSIGKLLNLLMCKHICRQAVKLFGVPKLVWAYNGYAFESKAIKFLNGEYDTKVVLEFEDWHYARNRGLSIKPLVDDYYCKQAIASVSGFTVVNESLHKYVRKHSPNARVMEMPGLVDELIFESVDENLPFAQNRGFSRIGYFGGLSKEKGLELFLNLVRNELGTSEYIVCGSGPLLVECKKVEHCFPKRLSVLTGLKYSSMLKEMYKCDVLINPHVVSKEFLDGIFPSKVLEGISTGRVYISTELPRIEKKEVLDGVLFFDGTLDDLILKLRESKEHYQINRGAIQASINICKNHYSQSSIVNFVNSIGADYA